MPHPTTLSRRLRAVAAALTLGLAPLAVAACGGGQPVAPLTTTITVTPTPTGSGTSAPTTPSTTSTTTTTPAATPPTTYDQAMQHFATGRVDAAAKPQFTSPTGNIFCSIAPGDVPRACEVRDGRATPPPGTCDTGGGGAKDVGRIEWSGDTPKPICNSDTMFQPGAQVLPYGSIAQASGSPVQCLSETLGITCVDTAAKKGFFLAKGAYTIF